jgi:Flp/Fap pilin component.
MEGILKKYLFEFCKEESGQGLTEYGLLLVFVSIVSVVIVTQIGNKVAAAYYGNAANRLFP